MVVMLMVQNQKKEARKMVTPAEVEADSRQGRRAGVGTDDGPMMECW